MFKCFFFLFAGTTMCFSQIITVSNGSSITISSNSSVYFDGLEFSPNENYTISGPNSIDRSSSPVIIDGNSSISRVYEMTNELSGFLGIVNFIYLDDELNGVVESDLVLEVLTENNLWTNVTPAIDENNNTLTYDFTEIIGFRSITASDVSATLTVKPVLLDGYVRVYPNPTTDFLLVVSNTPQKATLFNTAGQKILEANSATALDVIDLPSGVYLLNLRNSQNQISTFKIIKK